MKMVVHAARSAPIVAAVNSEGKIHIWNFETGDQLSEFVTVCDDGHRVAISATGETVVAANWRKGKKAGVACYEARSGRQIWHRPDLRQVQHMKFSAQGDWIWCEVDSRPTHCLDAKTGSTLRILRGVRDVTDSPYSPDTIQLRRQGDFVIGTPGASVSVPCLCRCGLTAAFSPGAVCLSEFWELKTRPLANRCVVRCIQCEDGSERWRYQAPDDHYMLLISYQDDQFFYAVQSGHEEDKYKWVTSLIRLTAADGSCAELCRLDSRPAFGGFGIGVLVTPEGEVVSLQTGAVTRKLQFSE
jgi:hypothetical protein